MEESIDRLSMVIVGGMAQNIFSSNGAVNNVLMSLGIIKEPIFWLGEGKLFWPLAGVINIWKEVGWNSIIYISTMTSMLPSRMLMGISTFSPL